MLNLRASLISFVNMGKKGKSTAIYTSTTAEGSESQAISATEITRKRQTRTAYRRSTEHLMETANEVLQLIHENPSSLSEQRTVILHQKITLNEKLKLVQGLDQEVLESLSEEDIVEETETADLFQDEVKFVIARLDAVFSAVSTPRMNLSRLLQTSRPLKTDKQKRYAQSLY